MRSLHFSLQREAGFISWNEIEFLEARITGSAKLEGRRGSGVSVSASMCVGQCVLAAPGCPFTLCLKKEKKNKVERKVIKQVLDKH